MITETQSTTPVEQTPNWIFSKRADFSNDIFIYFILHKINRYVFFRAFFFFFFFLFNQFLATIRKLSLKYFFILSNFSFLFNNE